MSDERTASAVDRELGERVRARRLEIAMSQERMAELLGVTFQQVQKYEKGVNRIAASRLYDISAALEVPVAYFFEGLSGARGDAMPGSPIEDLRARRGVAELVRFYVAIESEAVRARVLDLVRVMAGEKR